MTEDRLQRAENGSQEQLAEVFAADNKLPDSFFPLDLKLLDKGQMKDPQLRKALINNPNKYSVKKIDKSEVVCENKTATHH